MRVVEHAEQPTVVLRERVPMTELTSFFERAFHSTMAAIQREGKQPAGPPFGMYHGMPTDHVDIEAGFPVDVPGTAAGGVVPSTLPAGRVVRTMHVGPYDTMRVTYDEVRAFMAEQGLTPGEEMWECYLSDPEREPDPSTWRTEICWAIAE